MASNRSNDDRNLLEIGLKESGTFDLALDTGEALLDALSENEIVKCIPVLGSVVGLVKGGIAVRDALFIRKIRLFIFHADQVSPAARARFLAKIKQDPSFEAYVGQSAVLAIDQTDDLSKASLHGLIFAAFIEDQIDLVTLRRLQNAINTVPEPDLKNFFSDERNTPMVCPGDYVLFAAGLLFPYLDDVNNLVPNGDFSGGHLKFYVSQLGDILQNLIKQARRTDCYAK